MSDSTTNLSVTDVVHGDEETDDSSDVVTTKITQAMLTTVDNPWSPFDDYDEWSAYDTRMGYHSASLLARVAVLSNELSEQVYNDEITKAIDEIIRENVTGMFRKITRVVEI